MVRGGVPVNLSSVSALHVPLAPHLVNKVRCKINGIVLLHLSRRSKMLFGSTLRFPRRRLSRLCAAAGLLLYIARHDNARISIPSDDAVVKHHVSQRPLAVRSCSFPVETSTCIVTLPTLCPRRHWARRRRNEYCMLVSFCTSLSLSLSSFLSSFLSISV